jgi:PAS domain S-box-containing protein
MMQPRVAAFALAVVLLGAVTAINLRIGTDAAAAEQEVARTHHIRAVMRDLVSALQDVETGARGFVLTGMTNYLEPYTAGMLAVRDHMGTLRTVLLEADHQADLATLESLVADRAEASRALVQTRQTEGFEAAQRLVASGHGKAAMDQVRAHVAQMDDSRRHLLEAQADARAAAWRMQQATVAGGSVSLLMVIGIFALVVHESRLRARTLEDLARSEANLAVTLQSIGDGVLATDVEGRVTRLNAVAERLMGWTQAEAAGRPVADVFHLISEETREPAFLPVSDTLAKGTIHGLANHTVLIARDGSERPIADSCAPIRDRRQRVVGAVLVFRDVTAEREAALALRDSARQLRAAVDANAMIMRHSLDVICTIDGSGCFVFVSDASAAVWGYTPDELTGRRYMDFVHPDDHTQTDAAAAAIVGGQPLRDFRNRYRRKDGSVVPILWTATWSAEAQLMFCVARDISDREAADVLLRVREQRFRALATAGDRIIWLAEADGALRGPHPAWQALTGLSEAEIQGDGWATAIHEDDRAAVLTQWAAARAAGEPVQLRYRVRRHDDVYRHCLDHAVPVRNPDGSVREWVGSVTDETDEVEAKQALQGAHDEVRRANGQLGMASRHKDEFLANMSHELRTPLNAILGLSEALLERLSGPLTPRQEKSITTIAASGSHLLALINDILDLSKVEAGKLDLFIEPIDVAAFCQSCLAFIRTQAMQKEISVTFDDADAPTEIHADPKRLKQIAVNLLTNAVKFTERGGRIGLTVRSSPENDGVCLSVWDTGVGIAPADQPRLFQSFSQIDSGLSRAQDGTGLGLALVARLTELHGGSVSVVSAPGEGSEFTVTLPSAHAPNAAVAPADRRHIHTALIIDDDPLVGEQLMRYLGELDIESRIHSGGELALEAAQREHPDVILLDLQLPGESGWVVLARLKDHPDTKHIPVVVVSVLDGRSRSMALGAAAHFTKPVTRAQLATFFQRPMTPRDRTTGDTSRAAGARGPVVLLAEDNAANQVTIGGYLEDRGFVVHYAANGIEAVTRARLDRPDVILMDIQMPVLDGLAAIQEIRKDGTVRHIPIVALTALAMAGDRERCLAAGATEYMTKPASMRALVSMVTELTARPTEGPA